MNRRVVMGGLVVVAAMGVLAELRRGPAIFVQLGAGAAIALGLLLIYRIFETFEWAAFAPREEIEPEDEDDEEWIADDDDVPEWE